MPEDLSPLPRISPELPPPDSDNARAEANVISRKNLRKIERSDSMQSHLHYAGVLCFWSLVLALSAMAFVWLFHLLAPVPKHFLTEAQRNEIKTILLTAIGSSIVTDRIRKWFQD